MNKLSFQGIQTASAIGGLNIYKLTDKDKRLAEKLANDISLKTLMPGLSEYQYQIWDDTIQKALAQKCKNTFLLAKHRVPCGVLNYAQTPYMFNVNYAATWPVCSAQRVPFAGKALFLELFRHFLESSAQIIELWGIKNAPFDPVGKYRQLGFKMYGGDNFQELMRINREQAANTMDKFKDIIKLQSVKQNLDIDLFLFFEMSSRQKNKH